MNILVTLAADPEFAPWTSFCEFTGVAAGRYTLHRTRIGSAQVDFLVTGIGPTHAAQALASIDMRGYAACISSGLAGAVVSRLEVGTVIAAAQISDGKSCHRLTADRALLAAALAAGAKAIEGLVSSAQVATSAAEKRALACLGDAVDMESFTVVAAAQAQNIPAVAIRAISDRHDQAIPVDLAAVVDELGRVSLLRVLRMVARRPGQIADLLRLGRDSKTAADNLARFLNALLKDVVSSRSRLAP